MTIRPTRTWEYHWIIDLARQFHAEANLGGNFDPEGLLEFLKGLHEQRKLVQFIAVKGDEVLGCIVGVKSKQMMTDVVLLEELFWYVRPEHRGSRAGLLLIKRFAEGPEALSAGGVVMARLSAGHDQLHRYYTRNNFKEIETHYLRLWQSPQHSSQ